MITFLLIILISYLIGSVPSGWIIGKLLKNIDIREYGSGNVGATNVTRVIGRFPGILVLLLDILKGVIAVHFVSKICINEIWMTTDDISKSASAISVIAGHVFSVFLGFKGGKGVATGSGVFLSLTAYPTFCSIILFLVSFSITKLVSAGSIIASLSLPVFLIIWKVPFPFIIAGILSSFVILIKHISNIKRIFEGKELRVRF